MKLAVAVGLMLLGAGAMAEAPRVSPPPVARPTGGVAATVPVTPRPVARPDGMITAPATVASIEVRAEMHPADATGLAVARSPRPSQRPEVIEQAAYAAQEARRRGMICNDPDIQGEVIPPIDGPGRCGVDNPVRVRSVAGVTFSERPTIDCPTAIALKNWVERSAIPQIGSEGGGLSQLQIMGHYTCRNQIGSGTSRLSEHALGHAVDIGGFKLHDGSVISVLQDWGSRADGEQLRQMHRGACGIFGTVLGPNANAAHKNHFHFDTAHQRNGAYCR